MKKLMIPFLLLLNTNLFSQLNTDSLLNVLLYSKKYKPVVAKDYLGKSFQKFESNDGLEHYFINIDFKKRRKKSKGLSIVYRKYDKENRLLKRIHYNARGQYFGEFPPIELITYSKDSTTTDSYNYHNMLSDRTIEISDISGRIIETLNYDNQLHLLSKTVSMFNDSLNEVLIKNFDGQGNFKINDMGVSIVRQKLDSAGKEPVEEYFYDAEMKPVECDHKKIDYNMNSTFNYSHIKKTTEDGKEYVLYFNSKGELICETDYLGNIMVYEYSK